MSATGLAFLGLAGHAWQQQQDSRQWPQASGRLTQVQLALVDATRPPSGAVRQHGPVGSNRPRQAAWELLVAYEFNAQGQPHEGWRATSSRWLEPVPGPEQGASAELQALAEQLTQQWQAQQPVVVHHHPQDGTQSYLLYRADTGLRRGLWMGALLLAGGLGLLGAAWRLPVARSQP